MTDLSVMNGGCSVSTVAVTAHVARRPHIKYVSAVMTESTSQQCVLYSPSVADSKVFSKHPGAFYYKRCFLFCFL